MKKLLITAIATAGMAFGLRAADAGYLAGTDFEDGNVPSTGWTIPDDDPNQSLVNTANTDTYSGNVPTQWTDSNHDKFLAVKTTFGKPISLDLATARAMSDGAYFDSLVKMTVCDEAPAAETYAGAKIMVWAQENTDGTATSLWVRASAPDGSGWKSQDFQCAGKFDKADAWHRLTIKAIPDIFKAASAFDYVPGFVVYVDGEAIQCMGAQLTSSDLNDNAAKFNELGQLFVSLDQTSENKTTISAVAFDGQGSLDDVTLTSAAPSFAKDYEFFTIDLGANVTGFNWAITEGESGSATASLQLPYAANMVVTISGVTCTDGYMFNKLTADTGVTVDNDNNTFTVTLPNLHGTVNAQAAAASFNGENFATIADAAGAANAITTAGDYTLKLWNDCATGGLDINNETEGVNIIIDLAGKTITGTADDTAAIMITAGNVMITNSNETVEGTVNVGDATAAVVAQGDNVLITAGTYNGIVSLDAADSAVITGGKFDNVNNEADTLKGYLADGLAITDDGSYLVVAEIQKVGFIMTIVKDATPQYKIDEGEWTDWSAKVDVEVGKNVAWQYVAGDGVLLKGTTSGKVEGIAEETTIVPTFQTGTEANPYLIATETDLEWVAEHAAGETFAGKFFKQTADIVLTETWPGIGMYGKDNASKNVEAFKAGAFQGTYDGDNKSITGLKLKSDYAQGTATNKYIGFFFSTYNATIKNVKFGIANYGWDNGKEIDQDVGAGIVVGTSWGTTFMNIEILKGEVAGTDEFYGTHAISAFAGFTTGANTFVNCTNNLNLNENRNGSAKVAAFSACNQSNTPALTFENCVNKGNIYSTKGSYVAGFSAYNDGTAKFTNCSNEGSVTAGATGQIAQFVANEKGSATNLGGCTGILTPVAISNDKGTDFFFATVAGDVATLVKNADLAAGGTYKVMATGGAPVIELKEKESIIFDQTLATIVATGITAESGCKIEATGEGKVITYTAIKDAGWNPDADPTVKAGEVIKDLPTVLANVSFKQLSTWAAAKGVNFNDAGSIIPEAFLLNCANDPTAVEEAKANFKFTSFDPTDPPTAADFAEKGYNGTVTVKSYSDVACTVEADKGDQLFYKAILTPTPAPVKE